MSINKNISVNSESEIGTVIEILGNEAVIELNPQPACESCGARLVCVPDGSGKRISKVENTINAKIGQNVKIFEKSNMILKLSFLQYVLPITGFISGVFLIHFLNLDYNFALSDLIKFIGGIIGLFLCAGISRVIVRHIAKTNQKLFEINFAYNE